MTESAANRSLFWISLILQLILSAGPVQAQFAIDNDALNYSGLHGSAKQSEETQSVIRKLFLSLFGLDNR
jgi:hypothetical protein